MAEYKPKHHDFAKAIEKLKELPVAEVAGDVVDSVKNGKVSILTAETGSGKTLLANSMLADAVDEQVVVLVPRRFLAINAAEAIADLAEVELGEEVGFAVGQQAGDKSQFSPNTKLLFATYGYALSSGLLETANIIVADEVHEAGVDTSLARALLHKRMAHDPKLKVAEMSATLNAKKQAGFWEDIASTAIHHADGKAFPCENRHVNPKQRSVENTALDLIQNEGRKGIAIFRPGVGEVEGTVEKLREMCQKNGLTNVEVEGIYGDMDMEEREQATRPPAEGNVKIIVGTNVIESGVNIKWLDTGISDGKGKVPYFRDTGAEALVLEDLPQWRIVQQEGRVKRFTDGIFVLNSDVEMEGRAQQQTPEIERIALNRLVMHAAGYGINPLDLKYDGNVDKNRLKEAKEDLKRLELLTDDWTLTEKGEFVSTLPLGPEAGTMLSAAAPEIRDDAIELAAVAEVGGLRADYKESHGLDENSDLFDGLKAFRTLGNEATEEECEGMNVSWKRYKEVKGLIEDMHRRMDTQEQDVPQRKATRGELTHLVLHGSVNRLFEDRGSYNDMIRGNYDFEPANSSVVHNNNDRFAVGHLREIPSKSGEPMVLVQNITKVSKEALCELAASREGVFTDLTFERNGKGRDSFTANYFGKTQVKINISRSPSEAVQKLIEPAYTEFRKSKGDDLSLDAKKPDTQQDNKPQGVGNTQVEEIRAQQARGR